MCAMGISDHDAQEALDRLIGAETLARIEAPLEEAGALPNAAYTSEAFLQLENERLFARSWTLAGCAHQIPGPGDGLPVTVAGLPLVLLRNRDGEIRAFHNVCRHRGARILAEPCRGKRTLTCPYHAWSYDLEGRLTARPHFDGPNKHQRIKGGDAELGLKPVRCERWLDLIFVDISGTAPPLEAYLAPLTERLEGYDLGALRHAGSITFEVQANWKLVFENYIEPYHVFAVHPRLTRFAPMEIRTPSACDGPLFYNEYRYPAHEAGRGADLPHYPGLPEEWKQRGVWFQLFPSLAIEIYPDQFSVLQATPLGPEQTREQIHIYLIGEAADSAAHREARQGVLDMWRDLNQEDLAVLERLQQGRHSPGFDGGRLSPYWDESTRHFARLVVEGIR